jgi:hypothetical protein
MSSSKKNPLSVTLTIKVTNCETGKDTEQTLVGNAAFLVMDTDEHLMATMIGGTTPSHTVAILRQVQELHAKVCEASPEIAAAMLMDMIMRDEPRGKREKRFDNPLDSLLRDILHSRDPESPESADLKRFADDLEKLFKDN